ncbi:hypothetical protein I6F15_31475 [Bradyrhizobium sp. BRP14]|nr:hypothetical protein [Bradyrhizobium sp. BRP14]
MYDSKLERFFKIGQTANDLVMFTRSSDQNLHAATLCGIKEAPPYLHDWRLMTLADTVEFS